MSTSAPIAVVTGAGRRLGYDISQALLDRGYLLFALYRSRTKELEHLEKRGATTIKVNLADSQSVLECIDVISASTEEVNILVNNASEFTSDASENSVLADQATRLLQTNCISPMMLMHGLEDRLKRAGDAQKRSSLVVNITDIFAERPDPRFSAYCASKASLNSLTLSYSAKLAPLVRVNAIMPGPIEFLPDHTDDHKNKVLSETLLGRKGGFHSVTLQVLALLDNDFITGAQIPIDGGRRLAQGVTF